VQAETPYTLRGLERMLGVGRSVLTGLIRAGYVTPSRGDRNEYRFSFRDLVLLRTAVGLRAANVPQRKLLQSLRSLRAKLPETLPLSRLRITAVGEEVTVREGDAQWEAETGQLLLDLHVSSDDRGTVSFIAEPETVARKTAAAWFAEGETLEPVDRSAAEAAYRRAIDLQPDHVYAYVNLGALLCEDSRCADALDLYEQAERLAPNDPLVHFNHAVALEDRGRHEEALERYERCLKLDSSLSDAHFNAARLCDQLGDVKGALRHFNAFRRMKLAELAVDEET